MSEKIIPIEAYIEHTIQEVICIECKRRWIEVRPTVLQLKDIECPYCGETGTVIATGQELLED